MTTIGTILLVAVMLIGARVVWKMALEHSRKELAKQSKGEEVAPVAPVVVPENDRNWHLRHDLIERIKRGLVDQLEEYPSCNVKMCSDDGSQPGITHGEAYEILMPFLKKGYFAYKDLVGYDVANVTRFRITKHRDPEKNALEITEELLTKNAQL